MAFPHLQQPSFLLVSSFLQPPLGELLGVVLKQRDFGLLSSDLKDSFLGDEESCYRALVPSVCFLRWSLFM